MLEEARPAAGELEQLETQDWVESLHDVLLASGPERVRRLLADLQIHAQKHGVVLPVTSQTPYVNTIPVERQPAYPGNLEIERRIKSIVRWNAMAMVTRQNRKGAPLGIGGHISTFASAATLYEVGHNHFFRGPDHPCGGDSIYFQGHASPGFYSRAFLEGRISREQLHNFRRELAEGGGLPSYPHPYLMPDFWQFSTVSMGLGPIQSIYRARFMKYLQGRKLREPNDARVWGFFGDGETDEPETLGAISVAAREHLDNLIWVINCNLQRLDGPVRGNGKIVQELESMFRGAGWNVLKVLWGSDWDPLLAQDYQGLLLRRMGEVVDGEYQKYRVEGGDYVRQHFFGTDPQLLKMVEHLSDREIWRLRLGGHDPVKVYAAFHAAVHHEGSPTVILTQTIKGYGQGEAGEGKNISHQQKKLNEDEMLYFRDRFQVPISDEDVANAPFYLPPEHSIEMEYARDRRRALGGGVPARRSVVVNLPPSQMRQAYDEFIPGSGDREVSTTMVLVRLLSRLIKDPVIGKHIVPIVPDEARTFGMEGLIATVGIWSHLGQLYVPVDSDSVMRYKEATDGQILQDGITEAGAMADFIAAGTSHIANGVPMVPFFIYYSMFGFQRVGDLVWAAADMLTRGFMLGATAGRTTLNGEGLQHQDGHSHIMASTVPTIQAYDPAFAFELSAIVEDGIQRMYVDNEEIFYYITLGNEDYVHPPMPGPESRDGIVKGLYRFREPNDPQAPRQVSLLGSGAIMNEVLKAAEVLETQFGVHSTIFSATSYKRLREDALDSERWNRLNPAETPRVPHVTSMLEQGQGPIVAASDYIKLLADGVSRFAPRTWISLGTDGFGRSDSREALRDFFEVDHRYVAAAALEGLVRDGQMTGAEAAEAMAALGLDPAKPNPMYC